MNEPDAVEVEPVAKEPFFRAPQVVLILIAVLVFVHVAFLLAGIPYLLVRGPANRIARRLRGRG